MTLVELDYMARGYQRRQTDGWRQTRLLATILVNVNRDPTKTAALSPEELFALPGDAPWEPALSEEDFEATMARLAEFDTLQPAA